MDDEGTQRGATGSRPDRGPTYRGFLFSDLRGYTDFVERQGDGAAADLLEAYRALVRQTVARFGGAEIKTEGDSFYVVFPSASGAVLCALEISSAAEAYSGEHLGSPIRVGIGVHAGETVETDEGFVGSAVNVAARVCSQAKPGEVLVTEQVRLLTRTSVPVSYLRRGSPRLKGISEPIPIYRAVPATSSLAQRTGRRRAAEAIGMAPRSVGLVLAAVAVAVIAGLGGVILSANPAPSPTPQAVLTPPPTAAVTAQPTASPAPTPAEAQPLPCNPVQQGPVLLCEAMELEPGRYKTTGFAHELSFTLGPGWRLSRPEINDYVRLLRSDRPASALEFATVAQLSRLEPLPSPAADEESGCEAIRYQWDTETFVDGLRAQPWLDVRPEVHRVTRGGDTLLQRDVVIAGESGCGRMGDLVEFFVSSDGEPFYNVRGAKLRFLHAGEVPISFMIIAEAPTEAEFDALAPIADEVVQSLELPED